METRFNFSLYHGIPQNILIKETLIIVTVTKHLDCSLKILDLLK